MTLLDDDGNIASTDVEEVFGAVQQTQQQPTQAAAPVRPVTQNQSAPLGYSNSVYDSSLEPSRFGNEQITEDAKIGQRFNNRRFMSPADRAREIYGGR